MKLQLPFELQAIESAKELDSYLALKEDFNVHKSVGVKLRLKDLWILNHINQTPQNFFWKAMDEAYNDLLRRERTIQLIHDRIPIAGTFKGDWITAIIPNRDDTKNDLPLIQSGAHMDSLISNDLPPHLLHLQECKPVNIIPDEMLAPSPGK